MRTDELIRLLAADAPSPPERDHLLLALAAGFLVALGLIALVLGLRPPARLLTPAVALKLLFPLAALGLLLPCLLALRRPDGRPGWRLFLPLVPLAVLAVLAAIERVAHPAMPVWRADSLACLLLVPLFSLPVLAGLVLALRRAAPTDLTAAGQAAGLAAGLLAATAYALHCRNDDPLYLLAFYVPAILAVGLLGRIMGRRLLAW